MSRLADLETFEHVVRAIRMVIKDKLRSSPITQDTSLTDDLGLDSISFVDLTLALRDHPELTDFPMQEWVDTEADKPSNRFTVGSLVLRCEQYVTDARAWEPP